jgi:hypothetical protein
MKKEITYLILVVLIANMVLFALGKIGAFLFWALIAIGALYAYKVLPKLKS